MCPAEEGSTALNLCGSDRSLGREKTTYGRSSKKPTVGRIDDLPWVGKATYRRSFFRSVKKGRERELGSGLSTGRKVEQKSNRSPDIRERISGLPKRGERGRKKLLHQEVVEATHPFGRTRLKVDEIGAVTTSHGLGVDAVDGRTMRHVA